MLLEERIITEEYQGKFWTLMNLYMKSQDGKIKELLLWTEKESVGMFTEGVSIQLLF